MLDWLGEDGDRLVRAFHQVFGGEPRPFGKASTHIGGVSDGRPGVQWNAGLDPRTGFRWLGVNLEGMQYDGWPVARLLLRELDEPTLPNVIERLTQATRVSVEWTRDYWQATSRPAIREKFIDPTPILLRELTAPRWKQAVEGALSCLDAARSYQGRATQEVTLAGSGRRVVGPVSPHLTFVLPAGGASPWSTFFAEARKSMEPLYQWTVDRSAEA